MKRLFFYLALLLIPLGVVGAQVPLVTPQQPRPDGSLVHVVKQGDTIDGILTAYASYGLTPDLLNERNGWRFPPQFIFVDQEIIILPPSAAGASGQAENPAGAAPPVGAEVPAGDAPAADVVVAPPASTGNQPRTLTSAEIQALAPVEAIAPFVSIFEAPTGEGAALPVASPTLEAPPPTATEAVVVPPSPTATPISVTPEPVGTEDVSLATETVEVASVPSATPASSEAVATSSEGRGNRRLLQEIYLNATENEPLALTPTEVASIPTATEASVIVPTTEPVVVSENTQPAPLETEAATVEGVSATQTSTISVSAATPSPVEVANVADPLAGMVCLTLFEDGNQNALQDADEAPLVGGTFTLGANAAQAQADEAPVCVSDEGVITVAAVAPEGYGITTAPSLQVQVVAGRTTTVSFGAAAGYMPPAVPASAATEELTVPLPPMLENAKNAEDKSLLDTAADNSAFIVLGLAGLVLIGGFAIALAWRMLR